MHFFWPSAPDASTDALERLPNHCANRGIHQLPVPESADFSGVVRQLLKGLPGAFRSQFAQGPGCIGPVVGVRLVQGRDQEPLAGRDQFGPDPGQPGQPQNTSRLSSW